jgi:hypothetical protein
MCAESSLQALQAVLGKESTDIALKTFLIESSQALNDVTLLMATPGFPVKTARATLHKLRGLVSSVCAHEAELSISAVQEAVANGDFSSANSLLQTFAEDLANFHKCVVQYLDENPTSG